MKNYNQLWEEYKDVLTHSTIHWKLHNVDDLKKIKLEELNKILPLYKEYYSYLSSSFFTFLCSFGFEKLNQFLPFWKKYYFELIRINRFENIIKMDFNIVNEKMEDWEKNKDFYLKGKLTFRDFFEYDIKKIKERFNLWNQYENIIDNGLVFKDLMIFNFTYLKMCFKRWKRDFTELKRVKKTVKDVIEDYNFNEYNKKDEMRFC